MKVKVIESQVTGIERFSLPQPCDNRKAGLLVRIPSGVDLKQMLAQGPVFIRGVPKS